MGAVFLLLLGKLVIGLVCRGGRVKLSRWFRFVDILALRFELELLADIAVPCQ